MQWIEHGKGLSTLSLGIRRLTASRLRRPSCLPTLVPTRQWDRYLQRLLWLFGGR